LDVRKEYLSYCNSRCQDKRCDQCPLRAFMDAYLAMAGAPAEGAEATPATARAPMAGVAGPVESKIEDLIKQTKGGEILEGVRLEGRKAIVRFRGSALLKAVGIAISAVIRIFSNFPIIWEIELSIGDLQIHTQRPRAVDLVGEAGLDMIARDSKAFWNYFRPMVNDDKFSERVFKYLGGEDNDAPALVHQANLQNQQPGGF
jgi:hypothetical protein